MKRLFEIQQALKAPKDKNNAFGGFNYRNASDIIEAVKPLLETRELVLTLSDGCEEIAGKAFISATAELRDAKNGNIIDSAQSYAEISDHKGMTRDQATGAASSYARKYALCGLFAIDDSKDDPDALLRPTDIKRFITEHKDWLEWLKGQNFTSHEKWDELDLILAGKLISIQTEITNNLNRD